MLTDLFSQGLIVAPDYLKFPPLKKDKTNSLLWSLQQPSKKVEIHLFEDFELKLPWFNPHKAANQHMHRFVYLNPLTEKKIQTPLKKMYKNDLLRLKISSEIHSRSAPRNQQFSYELRCFFIRPGKDSIIIRPNSHVLNKFRVKGLPRVFSLWVKSNLKRHKLYALFSDYRKKISAVYMGDLAFQGWLRLEQMIPSYLIKRNPHNQNKYEITFEGLKVQSAHSEPEGLYIITFDLLMLSLDHSQEYYPGSQMRDDIRP